VDDDYLTAVFRRVSALQPDLVAHTGDLITYGGPATFAQAKPLLENFPRGRLGTVLRNQSTTVAGLTFVGLDDLWSGRFSLSTAFATAKPDQPSIALCHNPDGCDLPGWEKHRGWILAGHTHGGQCKPPFLPPPLLPVKNRRYTAGEFLLSDGRRLYISRGVGHLLRVRFNVRPEVTVFTLRAV
ncbi:MAG: phosphoesterase, partial [Opitutae bacterium]|nr:phosphoesterase [Opitutae bacterium]